MTGHRYGPMIGRGPSNDPRPAKKAMFEQIQLTRRDDDRRDFLLHLRRRIDPDTKVLGSYERLQSRRGRPVTQEEVAEAIGVSRGWYARLESGQPAQPSISMLHRIAEALKATPSERAILFRLAIPALESVTLCSSCGLAYTN
jgi:DNA-binding XRE family transcriptional regulator